MLKKMLAVELDREIEIVECIEQQMTKNVIVYEKAQYKKYVGFFISFPGWQG